MWEVDESDAVNRYHGYDDWLFGKTFNGTDLPNPDVAAPEACNAGAGEGDTCATLHYGLKDINAVAFAGRLDEVSIYKRALSAAEMLAVYDTVKGGQLFRLDEPPGSREFKDDTGAAKFTCAAADCPTAGVAGRIAQGAQFVPGNYLSMPWNGGDAEGSVSLWFKTGAVNTGLFSVGDNDRRVWLDGSGNLKAVLNDGDFVKAALYNAQQSTTYPTFGAALAIDGNVNTFNSTNANDKEWWQATLSGGDQLINLIRVYNRQDCCQERLNDFNVILYNYLGQQVWEVDHLQAAPNPNPTIIVVPLIRASRVKIQKNSANYLDMGEVEVYIRPPTATPETITTAGANFADTQWHHLLYTYGGVAAGQKIYVDGQLRAAGAAAVSVYAATGVFLGIAQNVAWLNGSLDQVHVYSRGLTAADAQRLYDDVPKVLFKFDETVNSTAFVNAANTGLATCTAGHCPVSGVAGRIGLATEFNGVTSTLQVNNSSALNFTSPFALGVWLNANNWSTTGAFRTIVSKDNQYYLWEHDSTLYFGVFGVGQITLTVPAANQWQHVVGNFTGGALQLWLNGSLATSANLGGTPATTASPLFIGGFNATGGRGFLRSIG